MPLMPAILLLLLILWNTAAGALTLTDEEKAWLAAHPQLSLGVDASGHRSSFATRRADTRDWPPITSPRSSNAWV